MQWELGRLAGCAHEQKQTDGENRRGFAGRLREDGFVVERAERVPDQENAERKTEVADTIDKERFLCRLGGARFLIPEANQQVAAKSKPFPKDVEEQEVAG